MMLNLSNSSRLHHASVSAFAAALLLGTSCSNEADASLPTELTHEEAQELMDKAGMSVSKERMLEEFRKETPVDADPEFLDSIVSAFDYDELNEDITEIVMEHVGAEGARSAIEFFGTEHGQQYLQGVMDLATKAGEATEGRIKPLIDAAMAGDPLPEVSLPVAEAPAPGTDEARLQEKIDRMLRLGIGPQVSDAQLEVEGRAMAEQAFERITSQLDDQLEGIDSATDLPEKLKAVVQALPMPKLRDLPLREVFPDEAMVDAVLAWGQTEPAQQFLTDMRSTTKPILFKAVEYQQKASAKILESIRDR
ncbi:MAG: hypothetical protein AAF196_03070 [Planctomycetota bacterium]